MEGNVEAKKRVSMAYLLMVCWVWLSSCYCQRISGGYWQYSDLGVFLNLGLYLLLVPRSAAGDI